MTQPIIDGAVLPVINAYIKTMEAKFITGAEPLSNIDKYFEELKKLGVDEYIKIQQEAYDTYKRNMK